METHISHKLQRVAAIYAELLELEKTHGLLVPSTYPWLQPYLRFIKVDGPWHARILEDSFITIARMTKKNVGEAVLHAPGWTSVEIFFQGQCRLAFSICGDVTILHRYKPGAWEGQFGVHNGGDTMALNPEMMEDDLDPRWMQFKKSGHAEWPPRFDPDHLL